MSQHPYQRHPAAISSIAGFLLFGFVWAGCGTGPTSGVGFRLPKGDPEKGKAAFLELKCHTCHSVSEEGLPKPDSPGQFNVVLGGEFLRVRTYGELVTSIINPTHIVSLEHKKKLEAGGTLSPMPEFNQVMTVAQMIDLVAFLQPHYKFPPDIPVIAN
jgi:hypothetical protein